MESEVVHVIERTISAFETLALGVLQGIIALHITLCHHKIISRVTLLRCSHLKYITLNSGLENFQKAFFYYQADFTNKSVKGMSPLPRNRE